MCTFYLLQQTSNKMNILYLVKIHQFSYDDCYNIFSTMFLVTIIEHICYLLKMFKIRWYTKQSFYIQSPSTNPFNTSHHNIRNSLSISFQKIFQRNSKHLVCTVRREMERLLRTWDSLMKGTSFGFLDLGNS